MTDIDNDVEYLMRVAHLKARMLALYSPLEVEAWFQTPQSYLQGRRPLDLMRDRTGYLEVSRMIEAALDSAFI